MKKKYVMERSELQLADIVLTTDKKSLSSAGIRTVTASRYSHAAIYVGGTLIEATLAGVFSKNPQRLAFHRAGDVAVLRSKKPLSDAQARRICDFAQTKVGSLYAIPEAMLVSVRSALHMDASRRQFCSRLVAQAYNHVGFDLENLREPAYCTPGQLARCTAFSRVESISRLGSEAEIEFAASEDPNEKHQRQTFEWLGRIRASVKSLGWTDAFDIQSIPDVAEFLCSRPDFDAEFTGYVQESGYLEFVDLDRRVNPFRYDVDRFIHQMIIFHDDAGGFVAAELEKEVPLLHRFCNNFDNYERYFRRHALEFFRVHVLLYFKLVQISQQRLRIISEALRKLGLDAIYKDVDQTAKYADKAVELGKEALRKLKLEF